MKLRLHNLIRAILRRLRGQRGWIEPAPYRDPVDDTFFCCICRDGRTFQGGDGLKRALEEGARKRRLSRI